LILVAPRYSVAVYLDSGSEATTKNYAYIKGVLDDALEGYARKGGDFRVGAENVKDGRHMFKHIIKFPCVKQLPNSVKEAFYALHHMWAIIQNEHRLTTPGSVRGWAEEHARIEDAELRDDFFRIQNQIATILQEDVITRGEPSPAPDRWLSARSKTGSGNSLTLGHGQRKIATICSRSHVNQSLHDSS
jgi:hypothetical protein